MRAAAEVVNDNSDFEYKSGRLSHLFRGEDIYVHVFVPYLDANDMAKCGYEGCNDIVNGMEGCWVGKKIRKESK